MQLDTACCSTSEVYAVAGPYDAAALVLTRWLTWACLALHTATQALQEQESDEGAVICQCATHGWC